MKAKKTGPKKAPVKVDSLVTRTHFAPISSNLEPRSRGYRITVKWNEEAQQWGEWVEEIADQPAGAEPASDGSEDMQPAIDARVDLLRHYARLADAEAPNLRKIGMAGLRRLAAQLLEADPAVRRLRAMGGDEHLHKLREFAQYAKDVGYPAKCIHKVFVIDAMKKFDMKERTVDTWLKEAKERNLLQ